MSAVTVAAEEQKTSPLMPDTSDAEAVMVPKGLRGRALMAILSATALLAGVAALITASRQGQKSVRGMSSALSLAESMQKLEGCQLSTPLWITSHQKLQLNDEHGALELNRSLADSKQWALRDAGDGAVFITSHKHMQLKDENGTLSLDAGMPNSTKWRVLDAGNGQVFIKSHRGEFLQDHNGVLKMAQLADKWEKWTIKRADAGAWQPACKFRGTRLFCFTVMRSWNHEPELMRKQREEWVGIYGCDEMLVISDKSVQLSNTRNESTNVSTSILTHDLLSKEQGEFLNSDLFLNVWTQVKADGRYLAADWTVKVDPETVFFPDRLRARLASRGLPSSKATFFANCAAKEDVQAKDHPNFMYGPIEVVSTAAVTTFVDGLDRCKDEVGLGEEMWEERFITNCLELLDVPMNTDLSLNLLSDGHCDNTNKPPDCTGDAVAFHPFPLVEDHMSCRIIGHHNEKHFSTFSAKKK